MKRKKEREKERKNERKKERKQERKFDEIKWKKKGEKNETRRNR